MLHKGLEVLGMQIRTEMTPWWAHIQFLFADR